MSTENLTHFQNLVASNPELRGKVAMIHQTAARELAGKIATLATESGMPFTANEFLSKAAPVEEELSDEQLEVVAGGRGMSSEMKVFLSVISAGLACAGMAIESKVERGDAARCI